MLKFKLNVRDEPEFKLLASVTVMTLNELSRRRCLRNGQGRLFHTAAALELLATRGLGCRTVSPGSLAPAGPAPVLKYNGQLAVDEEMSMVTGFCHKTRNSPD